VGIECRTDCELSQGPLEALGRVIWMLVDGASLWLDDNVPAGCFFPELRSWNGCGPLERHYLKVDAK
jgi:hypothetical protein